MKTRIVLTVGIILVFAVVFDPTKVGSQGCCVPPTSEVSVVDGETSSPPYGPTVTKFKMQISTSSNFNFDGRQLQEEFGAQGSNNCYYPGGPLPAHPQVSNPLTGFPPWIVAGGQVSGQHNTWGWDGVGAFSSAITQTRQDLGDLSGGPCVLVLFQNLWIECDSSTHWVYEENNVLQITFDNSVVENCRSAVLDSIPRCDQIIY